MRALVAGLLRLFPAQFRRAFGDDMLATFDDRWREQGNWRMAARTVADLTSSALIERCLPERRKGDGWMKNLLQDIRYALRMLKNSAIWLNVW